MRIHPNIKGDLIRKAAQTAGADLWIKFPRLQEWIDGVNSPTINQLAEFAKEVHIPFGFFFLRDLPEIKNTIPLFRSNSNIAEYKYSLELSETIRIIQMRQDWLIEHLQNEGFDELKFVGSQSVSNTPNQIADSIRKVLQLPFNWSQELKDKDAALKYLINAAEAAGIYVTINGVVGNSSRSLNPEEFKGFVLSNRFAPYIFINGKDYPAAKVFTFMHELAHIWLDKTAILDIENFEPANTALEKLCDAVAAELLVPSDSLLHKWKILGNRQDHLEQLEKTFKVSKIVIARRLLDLGIYTKAKFFEFYKKYKAYWDARVSLKQKGGGSFYVNQENRVGVKFFETVYSAASAGKLLYTDAYKLTNLYGNTFTQFKSYLEN